MFTNIKHVSKRKYRKMYNNWKKAGCPTEGYDAKGYYVKVNEIKYYAQEPDGTSNQSEPQSSSDVAEL